VCVLYTRRIISNLRRSSVRLYFFFILTVCHKNRTVKTATPRRIYTFSFSGNKKGLGRLENATRDGFPGIVETVIRQTMAYSRIRPARKSVRREVFEYNSVVDIRERLRGTVRALRNERIVRLFFK